MATIVKTTTKGQVTLPAVWRKKFNTNQYLMNFNKNKLTIEPIVIMDKKSKELSLKKIIEQESKKSDLIIFNAYRDNNGKGIEVDKFIKVLEEIDE